MTTSTDQLAHSQSGTLPVERSLENLLRGLPTYFRPQRAGTLRAVVECRLGHAAGEDRYQVVIAGGRCRVEKDGSATPDVVLEADPLDFLRLALGEVTASRLVLHGRLSFTGNVLLASRLRGLFAIPTAACAQAGAGI